MQLGSSRRVIGVVLATATVAVYGRTLGFGFVNIDDSLYAQNPRVVDGLSFDSLLWAFTTFDQATWQPLTWLSLMIDSAVGGGSASLFHFTNLLFHLLNTLLLLLLLDRATGARWPSAFVAGMFALHPLHVEAVAWVTARKDVLSTFFWLLAMLAYLAWVRRPSRGNYLWIVGWFAAALMSKPMPVSMPLLLLLLDVWPLKRWGAGVLREKIPLFAMAAAAAVVAVASQAQGEALQSTEILPLGARLANAALSYGAYLVDSLWPVGLAVLVPHPVTDLSYGKAAAAALALAAVTIAALVRVRRSPQWLVGWGWYLVTLVPVIGLVQFGVQARADRFTYVPSIGLFLLVAWFFPRRISSVMASRPRNIVLALAATIALVACGLRSYDQVGTWRDSETLHRHALAVYPEHARAHYGLGIALHEGGDAAGATEQFREALRISPSYAEAHANLAAVLARQGDPGAARSHFDRALQLEPRRAAWRAKLGTLLLEIGQGAEAEREFNRTLELDPDNGSAHNGLGVLHARRADWPRAIEHFREATRLDPDNDELRGNLERALRAQASGR